jgi:hypothetical protein
MEPWNLIRGHKSLFIALPNIDKEILKDFPVHGKYLNNMCNS